MSLAIAWHMITGEYPPQSGGVSDYSRVVARGLAAAGDAVHVWAPENPGTEAGDEGVTIHRLPGHFGPRALAELSRSLGRRAGARLLVQYVPHAFGFKAMNLPFCLWLHAHTRKNGGAAVMFHEVNLGLLPGDPARYRLLDAATKVMAMLVARSAAQIFIATPVWEPLLRRYVAAGRPIAWMPVPSTVAVVDDCAQIAAARRRCAPAGGPVIGHFGSYPPAIVAMLRARIPRILAANPALTMALIGANSGTFRESFVGENPDLSARVVATGALAPAELSIAISSCDVMVQPYPDGVSSRRTSIMAALDHARAIVTTAGLFTEPLWRQSGAVDLVEAGDAGAFSAAVTELIADGVRRRRYAITAKTLYADRFDLRHTIEALRAPACA